MQIQPYINSDNKNKTKFKRLNIEHAETWPIKALESFVKNQEVKKLTKVLHKDSVNISASYNKGDWGGNDFVLLTPSNSKNNFYTAASGYSGDGVAKNMRNFSAKDALLKITGKASDKIAESVQRSTLSQELDAFNASLDKTPSIFQRIKNCFINS